METEKVKIKRGPSGHRVGEGHQRAKLSDAQVLEIRAKNAAGVGYRKLAAEYGCGQSTIRDFCTLRTRFVGLI